MRERRVVAGVQAMNLTSSSFSSFSPSFLASASVEAVSPPPPPAINPSFEGEEAAKAPPQPPDGEGTGVARPPLPLRPPAKKGCAAAAEPPAE